MDETQRIAKYHLKFLNGTRKNPVTLKFSMQVQVVGGAGTVTVESPSSNPFIVITNECQYEESDGCDQSSQFLSSCISHLPSPHASYSLIVGLC